MSKDIFVEETIPDDPHRKHELLAIRVNARGYMLSAIRLDFHEDTLEFIQVDFPDGTSAYFSANPNGEGDVVAGPFGGGYSWACPKYVVKAAADLLRATFQTAEAPA